MESSMKHGNNPRSLEQHQPLSFIFWHDRKGRHFLLQSFLLGTPFFPHQPTVGKLAAMRRRCARIKLIDFGSACTEQSMLHTYIQSRFYRREDVFCVKKCGWKWLGLGGFGGWIWCVKFRVFLMAAGSCLVVVGKYAMTFIDVTGRKTTKMLPSDESKSGMFGGEFIWGKMDRPMTLKTKNWDVGRLGHFVGGSWRHWCLLDRP